MDRNKWDTAIRCLEVALHPRTGDEETLAAVNGFRRTAGGMPLTAICAAVAAQSPSQRERFARLARINRDLVARLEAAMRQIAALESEARAATARADGAERRVAELRAAHAALTTRRRDPPVRVAASRASFGEVLAAAMGRTPAAPSAPSARFPWRA